MTLRETILNEILEETERKEVFLDKKQKEIIKDTLDFYFDDFKEDL